jgi:predicted nucleotidyltransferase
MIREAVLCWVEATASAHPDVLRIGYIGSYARGDWGVGSDLDLIVVVERSGEPFWRRGLEWDLSLLPVPTDLLVYTQEEWQALAAQGGRFHRTVEREAVWVYERVANSTPCQTEDGSC